MEGLAIFLSLGKQEEAALQKLTWKFCALLEIIQL